jgi:hypothetical protein
VTAIVSASAACSKAEARVGPTPRTPTSAPCGNNSERGSTEDVIDPPPCGFPCGSELSGIRHRPALIQDNPRPAAASTPFQGEHGFASTAFEELAKLRTLQAVPDPDP